MLNKFKKVPQIAYTVMSLAAVAAINYSIIHNSLVFVFLAVLLAHELGHYFTGKRFGAKVKLPIFLPIPFVVVALTKISKLTDEQTMQTAFYGPFVGFVTSMLFLFFNIIFSFTYFTPLIILAVGEIVFNYFGTDGNKYRKAKGRLKCMS